jgi:hypothetical protein
MVTHASAVPEHVQPGTRTPGEWGVTLLAGVGLGPTLSMSAVFLSAWVFGDWVSDLHTSIAGVHALAGLVAAGGCFLFVASSYVAVRGWQLRHLSR